jgi:hypothetical protein
MRLARLMATVQQLSGIKRSRQPAQESRILGSEASSCNVKYNLYDGTLHNAILPLAGQYRRILTQILFVPSYRQRSTCPAAGTWLPP